MSLSPLSSERKGNERHPGLTVVIGSMCRSMDATEEIDAAKGVTLFYSEFF